ncbi:MAG: hypothetical protein O7H40_06165 [Gammaproteobacteria bacterium]|nr:hypothetical protein [Gammaproteobacteria bacterium]
MKNAGRWLEPIARRPYDSVNASGCRTGNLVQAATIFYEEPTMYRRGHLKVDLDFEYARDFIGLAADARTGRYLPSAFLFLIGPSRPRDSLRWIPGTIGISAPLHVLTLRRRSRSGTAGIW